MARVEQALHRFAVVAALALAHGLIVMIAAHGIGPVALLMVFGFASAWQSGQFPGPAAARHRDPGLALQSADVGLAREPARLERHLGPLVLHAAGLVIPARQAAGLADFDADADAETELQVPGQRLAQTAARVEGERR